MSAACFHTEAVHVPSWVCDLESFRRWAISDEAPEKVPVFYLAGEVWIDSVRAEIFSHNQVKGEIGRVLGNLEKPNRKGQYFSNGFLFSNEAANLSGNPDGVYVTNDSIRCGRVRVVKDFMEMEGSPDMVLEVVSDNSVEKDTVMLRNLYWKAGIREYWLVDARRDSIEFDILRQATRGYSATRKSDGWIKSAVFGQSFRLTRESNELGHPEFTLDVR